MPVMQKLRKLLCIGAIAVALAAGAPMRPDEIEELLIQLDQPKVAQVLRKENDDGDELPEQSYGGTRAAIIPHPGDNRD